MLQNCVFSAAGISNGHHGGGAVLHHESAEIQRLRRELHEEQERVQRLSAQLTTNVSTNQIGRFMASHKID